ncbi:MAG: YibE/F family protein [Oscillospiraceae bacterium]
MKHHQNRFRFLHKKAALLILLAAFFTLCGLFVYNDSFLYQAPVIKITTVSEETLSVQPNDINGTETLRRQTIKGIVLNTAKKGTTAQLTNEYSSSEVSTTRYETGDRVFAQLSGAGGSSGRITGLKRDFHIFALLALFILLSVAVCGKRGMLFFCSLALNTIVFLLAVKLYLNGIPLLLLGFAAMLVFAVATTVLTCGIKPKALVAGLSAVVTSVVTIALAILVLHITDGAGVRFDKMEYLAAPYEELFLVELLIGSFGAVMDTAVTIATSLSEISVQTAGHDRKTLAQAGREIGLDIMGTMSSILFFANIAGCIPMIILALRNNVTFFDVIHNYISLEITRSLVGSIGIVLTIPITVKLAALLFEKMKSPERRALR